MQKKYVRIFATLLCVFLLATLTACNKTTDPSASSSEDAAPETPKTNAEKFIEALDAYETYFNDISDAFGTKLPAVSDHGTTDLKMTIPVFSIFGESQTDVFDADKPILQATIVQAGDLAHMALTAAMYGEQLRMEIYGSATEGILVFPDLQGQAPIRLTAGETTEEAVSSVTDIADAYKKLLDSLEDDSLQITEEGDACSYVLRLTPKQLKEFLTDIGLDEPLQDSMDALTDEDYMQYDLTTVNGLPTELRVRLYNEGGTKVASEIDLKTSVTGSNTTIDMAISAGGETLLSANAAITATQGSIVLNATLDMGEIKLTANVRLLSESESSITLDGTAEVRMNMEEGAAFTLPLTIKGKITADGDTRETVLEVNSSSNGIFDLTLRFEARFTPGETVVILPEGAVDAEQVDSDALMEALKEVYPQIFEELLGGEDDFDWGDIGGTGYMSEDENVFVSVYEDDTIYLYAFAVECVDNGKSLTFSYNGKSLGSYDYTVLEDDIVEICGMQMYVEELGDGWKEFYFEDEANESIWVALQFVEDDVLIDLCLPFETVDGVTKILLPDGTALPFDVTLPEDELSPLQIGSLTLPRYVDSDPV